MLSRILRVNFPLYGSYSPPFVSHKGTKSFLSKSQRNPHGIPRPTGPRPFETPGRICSSSVIPWAGPAFKGIGLPSPCFPTYPNLSIGRLWRRRRMGAAGFCRLPSLRLEHRTVWPRQGKIFASSAATLLCLSV